jgi:hypothetical protein
MEKDIKNKTRDQGYYIEELQKHFPNLSKDQLKEIIREGLFQLQFNIVVKKKDVVLKNSFKKLNLTFFKYLPSFKRKKHGDSKECVPNT